jgi:hypothetical protein
VVQSEAEHFQITAAVLGSQARAATEKEVQNLNYSPTVTLNLNCPFDNVSRRQTHTYIQNVILKLKVLGWSSMQFQVERNGYQS